MIKKILLFATLVIVLSACQSYNKEIKEVISNADSVAINYFKGDGTTDTVVDVRIIRDKNSMDQLVNFIAAQEAQPKESCGYDGSIHFFKQDSVVQDIRFRMNADSCMYFTFKQDGKTVATVLSTEAKQLLESFRK
jgi:hypothetical protein